MTKLTAHEDFALTPAAAAYRVDYTVGNPGPVTVEPFGEDRKGALARARKLSRDPDIALGFVIRTVAGQDTGQRVYAYGDHDYDEGEF